MITNAAKANAIVTSVIPDHIRDRLLVAQEAKLKRQQGYGNLKSFLSDGRSNDFGDSALADLFLETTVLFAGITGEKNIARNVFQHFCCLLLHFCWLQFVPQASQVSDENPHPSNSRNIKLFSSFDLLANHIPPNLAWSSTREPSQVFKLLETLFSSFDHVARKRRILKVETVGDCFGNVLSAFADTSDSSTS